ncbi:4Fe-4S dicluster domain-containing protein [Chloroflexota bacterium]
MLKEHDETAHPAAVTFSPAKYKVAYESSVCDKCVSCAAACSTLNFGESNPQLSGIRLSFDIMYAETIDVKTCQQCLAPSCMQACLFDAISIDDTTGARVIDQDKCTGCRLCEIACPEEAVVYNSATNKCFKCDLCGGDPECVKQCPAGALSLVSPTEGGI